MRRFPVIASFCAVATMFVADTAQAAWNNVFQVNCFRKRRTTAAYLAPAACCPQTVVAAAAPACPQPCQPQCTTQYIQRSYYQPVTTYKQQCYYEPITTNQTSYYYEPVTSYRYSCYYDPCTCSYQQVAQPVTSYRLRSKCNPVTSYLQRTQMVPVSSYQLSHYYEPVTTCCNTTTGAPIFGTLPATAQPSVPAVGEQQQQQPLVPTPSRPRVGEDPSGASDSYYRRYRETNPPPMNGAEGSSFRQPRLDTPVPATPPVQTQPNPPRVRLDRIVMLEEYNVEGQIVRAEDRTPRANVKLLFVSAEEDRAQQSLTSDASGRFQATLAKGSWLVYVRNPEGTPVFQKRIEVKDGEKVPVQLTSR